MEEDNRNSQDVLISLPSELQHQVLYILRREGGIRCLFPHRSVCRRWCEIIDDHLYHFFVRGPDTLYCYVNLWNRFRQKLIQQRVVLRLRVRTVEYQHGNTPPEQSDHETEEDQIIDSQPSSESSQTPSLSPRKYV